MERLDRVMTELNTWPVYMGLDRPSDLEILRAEGKPDDIETVDQGLVEDDVDEEAPESPKSDPVPPEDEPKEAEEPKP